MKNEVNHAFMAKKILFYAIIAVVLAACQKSQSLEERATELCAYIPDHQLLEKSRDYMTEDFYAVLDTMFYRLPEHEAMDHEWLYYFVTGNGGAIADFEVVKVEQTDSNHALATISVRQVWEDGSFDESTDIEEHRLYMERVNGEWLISDFDEHKADCIRYIAINRHEQAVRQAISDYLLREIAPFYQQGELCLPTLMMVHETDSCVWGDFWVYWYNISGDTLKTVSGGNHAGRMTICETADSLYVTAFVQTEDGAGNDASARRIFGDYYDIYESMHSNERVREAVRREQIFDYVQQNNLPLHYYQDYGWPAVQLFPESKIVLFNQP